MHLDEIPTIFLNLIHLSPRIFFCRITKILIIKIRGGKLVIKWCLRFSKYWLLIRKVILFCRIIELLVKVLF